MSRFTDTLLVSPLPDGKTWIVRRDFGYDIGQEGSDNFVDVPIGFMTDFASVPRFLWAIIPQWGTYGNATVIHDYLYWVQSISCRIGNIVIQKSITRKEADDIFLEAMGVLKVSGFYKYAIYCAVRIFAGFAWKENRMAREKGEVRILSPIPEELAVLMQVPLIEAC